jgi:hypothetical protein
MQFSDTPGAFADDANTVFAHATQAGNVAITGTEAGDPRNGHLIEVAAADHDWWLFVHRTGEWVAFDRAWASHVNHGFVAVVAGRSGFGGHAPRGIAWVTLQPRDTSLPRISVGAMHYLTVRSLVFQPRANRQLQNAAVAWARDKSAEGLAFIGADVNMNDRVRNVFGSNAMTTCWDELHQYPGTHGHRTIDVIARLTGDDIRFTDADTHPALLHSDHHLIEATVELR